MSSDGVPWCVRGAPGGLCDIVERLVGKVWSVVIPVGSLLGPVGAGAIPSLHVCLLQQACCLCRPKTAQARVNRRGHFPTARVLQTRRAAAVPLMRWTSLTHTRERAHKTLLWLQRGRRSCTADSHSLTRDLSSKKTQQKHATQHSNAGKDTHTHTSHHPVPQWYQQAAQLGSAQLSSHNTRAAPHLARIHDHHCSRSFRGPSHTVQPIHACMQGSSGTSSRRPQ